MIFVLRVQLLVPVGRLDGEKAAESVFRKESLCLSSGFTLSSTKIKTRVRLDSETCA